MPSKFPSKSETSIPAGYYDKPITIQSNTGNRDSIGTEAEKWTDYIKTWAHISYKTGNKQVQADQVYPTKKATFYIRYRPSDTIDTKMRVKYKDHIYSIISVLVPEEAQTNIEIYAEEQRSSGSP